MNDGYLIDLDGADLEIHFSEPDAADRLQLTLSLDGWQSGVFLSRDEARRVADLARWLASTHGEASDTA